MKVLTKTQQVSLIYHHLFNYPLTHQDLEKWDASSTHIISLKKNLHYQYHKPYYFLKNNNRLIALRKSRQKYSNLKLKLAHSAARKISLIPTIQFIGITGSLAMRNTSLNSDIDFIIITRPHTLWLTRLLIYAFAPLLNLHIRNPNLKTQKDLLCLNIWLDQSDLKITPRNIYTAHELAQIIPLINRGEAYQHLLWQNKWLLTYWPNAVKISRPSYKIYRKNIISQSLNHISYRLQCLYMTKKITNEKISTTQAFFHPNNLSTIVQTKLAGYGVKLD